MTWRVPREWAGEPAFILGGGASLKSFDASRLKGRGRIIAVNDAGLDMAPDADLLFFADGMERWYGWNRDRLHLFTGQYLVTRVDVPPIAGREILKLERDHGNGLSRDPGFVAGFCGGSNAINIAYLFGCDPIYLLGFDLAPGHWHDNHKLPTPDKYESHFIPSFNKMAAELHAEGVKVLNCNPASRLTCFPFADPFGDQHA